MQRDTIITSGGTSAGTQTAWAPRYEPEPDLTHYYAVHQQMRVDLRRFVVAVDRAEPFERAGRLRALARWAVGFGHELHVHHTVEDRVLFPDLLDRAPVLSNVLDRLEADHHVVDGILGGWRATAEALADERVPFAQARGDMLFVALRLRDLLIPHVDLEDEDVLPQFARLYTGEAYDALTKRATKLIPKQGLGFAVPWNVRAMPDDESRAHLIADAPLPLRVVLRLTEGRHARLVADAFAGVPEPSLVPA